MYLFHLSVHARAVDHSAQQSQAITHQEHHDADDAEHEAKVAQPEAELGLRGAPAEPPAPHRHPQVRHAPADLLADDGADDDGDHLQAVLLRVEAEELGEQLRDLDGDHDARPEELHGVRHGGDRDAGVRGVREGLDEVVPRQGRLVDAAEARVLPLEAGLALLRLGGLGAADVARLGPEEEVEDELDGVCLQRRGILAYNVG